MSDKRFHYGWVVILAGLLVTIGAHGFGRMSYTIILPAMKDGLGFNYTQLGLLGTGNFIGYLVMAIIGGFLAAHLYPGGDCLGPGPNGNNDATDGIS